MALACLCRKIEEDDFPSQEALKARVLQDDFVCGQCQLRYLASFADWTVKEPRAAISPCEPENGTEAP